jgi:hypothetical protein
MPTGFQVTSFRYDGRAWLARSKRNAAKGLREGLGYVRAEARKIVPFDTGALDSSSEIVMVPGEIAGGIVFKTEYAAIQHERLDFKHKPGRSAKYLEIPMNANRDLILEKIAAAIREGGYLGRFRR